MRSGTKEFKNNKGYEWKELWTESADGLVLVERQKDDGHGTKTVENYKCKWNGDCLEYETEDNVIDIVGQSKKILV